MDGVGFWETHQIFGGFLFLALAACFPRLHLFLGSIVFAAFSLTLLMPGFVVFLLWLFLPRMLVAYAASMFYWDTNPVLVVIAWLIALFAEMGEKVIVVKTVA